MSTARGKPGRDPGQNTTVGEQHSISGIPTRNKAIFKRKHRLSPALSGPRGTHQLHTPPPIMRHTENPASCFTASAPQFQLVKVPNCKKSSFFHFWEGFSCQVPLTDIPPGMARGDLALPPQPALTAQLSRPAAAGAVLYKRPSTISSTSWDLHPRKHSCQHQGECQLSWEGHHASTGDMGRNVGRSITCSCMLFPTHRKPIPS